MVRGLKGGGRQGPFSYAGGIPKGVALGGDPKGTISKSEMGEGGADNTVLPEEFTWTRMVLLPKGRGGYLGIRLVELTCKVCVVVLNARLKKGVELHDALHGFW